jgi:DNA recombination protein RmuC
LIIVLLFVILGLLIINLILSIKIIFDNSRSKDIESIFNNIENKITGLLREELRINREELNNNVKQNREELSNSFKSFDSSLSFRFNELVKTTEEKLEKMRETVDEKLHKTLEERLGESFKRVSEHLESVQKGLGEMQSLATGVGDLKKVLSNVKTRGILGEIQLENILEQILTPEQYEKNVITKKDSRESVEFAVKLPGKDDYESTIYLPIDSKFPLDNYHNLIDSYDSGDSRQINNAEKQLEKCIKKCAKDIRDKYIDPPNTTEFAIMFLPIEGLYAEVVKRTNLVEILQRDYKIIISGPTIIAAFLNSLRMGFKTLAIEKHSSEVWKVLGAVKTEFQRFGDVLEKAQKKISQASNDIDSLVGVRTRQIQKKLKNVQEISSQKTDFYLFDDNDF